MASPHKLPRIVTNQPINVKKQINLKTMNNAESQMRIVFSYDMWQLGCIMYELFVLAPLISKNEADPLARLVAFSRHDIKVDDVQAQQTLRLRKLKQRKVEFDLLYYAFNGVGLIPRYFVQHVTLVLRRGNYL